MQLLFYFAIPLISSVITIGIIIFFLFCRRKSKYQPNVNNGVPVIEILKTLAKICPISSLNKWLLLPLDSGSHRCWMQTLLFPMTKSMNLYGSSAVINSSSLVVGSLIVDVAKWTDWNPFYSSELIVKSFDDKQLKSDHYMEAEQIFSIVRKIDKIHSDIFMYRFHNISQSKVIWILFWHVKKLEFLFFLVQPVKNKKEPSRCLLTHIIGKDIDTPSSATHVLQRIRNIQDLLTLSSVFLTPLRLASSSHSNNEGSFLQNEVQLLSSSHENIFSLPATRARKRSVRNSMYILIPFETSIFWFWRKKEFKLGLKTIDIELETKLLTSSFKQIHRSKNKSSIKNSLRRVMSDVGLKYLNFTNSSKKSETAYTKNEFQNLSKETFTSKSKEEFIKRSNHLSDTGNENSEEICSSKTSDQLKIKDKIVSNVKLQSLPEKVLDDSFPYQCKAQNKLNCEWTSKLQDVNENSNENVLAIENENQRDNSSISDFEVLDYLEYSENRIAGFMTQGNYGASELQAEVLLASQLKEDSNNFQSAVGWMFHSHYKGLVVLSKSTSSQFLKISSFLCQIELSVNPKDVWKFVKNPQFRFICDETVKNVEVLEKISSSQKLIHTYHEIGGLLRKELVDFCLLQTEREELNKYYSCFYSIECDKCPFMKSVTRGTLRPSGWIVEEVDNGIGKSKITYMIQILINSPDSLLIQELGILVPQSILNLKNYIASKPM